MEEKVVGINKSYEFSFGQFNQDVASGGDTGIGLPLVAQLVSGVVEHVFCAVGGTIIDNDDFIVLVGLSKDAVQSLSEIIFTIIGGNSNADFGVHKRCHSIDL
jgi:hypothetical protein